MSIVEPGLTCSEAMVRWLHAMEIPNLGTAPLWVVNGFGAPVNPVAIT